VPAPKSTGALGGRMGWRVAITMRAPETLVPRKRATFFENIVAGERRGPSQRFLSVRPIREGLESPARPGPFTPRVPRCTNAPPRASLTRTAGGDRCVSVGGRPDAKFFRCRKSSVVEDDFAGCERRAVDSSCRKLGVFLAAEEAGSARRPSSNSIADLTHRAARHRHRGLPDQDGSESGVRVS